MAIDILKSGLSLREETVYVLGSGPNGIPHYESIPRDAFVIAVNQAIEIQGINKSIWLCADGMLPEKEWFQRNAKELLAANNPLEDVTLPTPVFSEGVLLNSYPEVPYHFMHGRTLVKQPWGCEEGVLRGGATIGSQAVQLAYLLGCRNIILCGIDMHGEKYFNGSDTDNVQTMKSKTWAAATWFNILIKWLRENSCIIESVSKTKLNIRRMQNAKINRSDT